MAFESADKKRKFGSIYVKNRYDTAHPAEEEEKKETPEEEKAETPEVEKEEQDKGEEKHPVVKEHGPAHTVTIKHDRKNKKHRVTSQHEDGHTHMSEHETPEAAFEDGGKLSDISMKKIGIAGDQQGAASEGDNDNVGGFVAPPLA